MNAGLYFYHLRLIASISFLNPSSFEIFKHMVREFGGPEAKIKTFSGYIDECWREAMAHSDTQLKTAPRPAKAPAAKPVQKTPVR